MEFNEAFRQHFLENLIDMDPAVFYSPLDNDMKPLSQVLHLPVSTYAANPSLWDYLRDTHRIPWICLPKPIVDLLGSHLKRVTPEYVRNLIRE